MQAGCRLSNLFNAGCVKFCRKDALLGLVSTRPKKGRRYAVLFGFPAARCTHPGRCPGIPHRVDPHPTPSPKGGGAFCAGALPRHPIGGRAAAAPRTPWGCGNAWFPASCRSPNPLWMRECIVSGKLPPPEPLVDAGMHGFRRAAAAVCGHTPDRNDRQSHSGQGSGYGVTSLSQSSGHIRKQRKRSSSFRSPHTTGSCSPSKLVTMET